MQDIGRLVRDFPVVAIVGARQVGKSTLARELFESAGGRGAYLDPGDATYPMADRIVALPLSAVWSELEPLS